MKMHLLSLVFLPLGHTALAGSHNYVDDMSLIDLRDDAAVINRTYPYPGMADLNGAPSADCLILVTGSGRMAQPDGADLLKDAITVFDGDDIIVPGGEHRTLNTLDPQIIGGSFPLVYYFKDLSRYLTGVRVATKDGRPLATVIDDIGFEGPVALQIVRGCRVLPTVP